MSRNRDDLERDMIRAAGDLVDEKGYAAFVDVLVRIEALAKADYENWRFGRVPCLERAVRMNLAKINRLMKAFRTWARGAKLRPSHTAYRKWGKGAKHPLRFTKSGVPVLEEAWSTHYALTPAKSVPRGGADQKPVVDPSFGSEGLPIPPLVDALDDNADGFDDLPF